MPTESPRESAYSTYTNEDVEMGPAPDAFRAPLPEGFRPQYFPYRGTEQHGVDPGLVAKVEDEDAEGGKVPLQGYEPPEPDANPVPVRIVDSAVSEYKQWRTYQVDAPPAGVMVVGRKSGRTKVQVQNISTNLRCWVGPDNTVSAFSGFPLTAGASVTLESEAPVWAVSDTAVNVPLAVLTEFSTAQ